MTEYLFLYGTLRPAKVAKEAADIVRRLRRVGPARVFGRLYDLGEYPGAVLDSLARTSIRGELFELPNDPYILSALDKYEEFDKDNGKSLFVRKKTNVEVSDGRRLESWIYVYNRDPGDARVITSGDYSESEAA
jgi:gamma-glutamylcyclotransferase (GGCT)/AIG2-like uncharacterized protein YtfP